MWCASISWKYTFIILFFYIGSSRTSKIVKLSLFYCTTVVPGRRTTLPAPGTDNSHIGIVTILYNNIGKDLSRVSMPVALNEPLSLLQRLSEELEYPELLNIANHTDDPYERMVSLA